MIKIVSMLLAFLTAISIIATYQGIGLQGINTETESASVRSSSTSSSYSSSSSGWSSGK